MVIISKKVTESTVIGYLKLEKIWEYSWNILIFYLYNLFLEKNLLFLDSGPHYLLSALQISAHRSHTSLVLYNTNTIFTILEKFHKF